MTLQFQPAPYREPDERSGADIADMIGQNLNQFGKTIGRNRELDQQAQLDRRRLEMTQGRYDNQDRLDRLKLAMDEGLDPRVIDEFLSNPRPASSVAPRKILAPAPSPRPILGANRLNLPADYQEPAQETAPFPMGTKRIQAQEDRDLNRRKTESEIEKNKRAYGGGGGKPPPAGYRWSPDGMSMEAIPGGPAYVKAGEKSGDMGAAYNLYQTARQGLLDGLRGTNTGPIMGRVPAFTSGQQIAQGGVAAMAPVLKQLFRVAGEGVFTDRDQQLLLDMIPTRTANPDAITTQMENIDNIVRAKLRMTGPGGGGQMPAGQQAPGGFDPDKEQRYQEWKARQGANR